MLQEQELTMLIQQIAKLIDESFERTKKTKKDLGLFLMCDMVEHLREHSQPFWSWGMKAVIGNLHDKDPGNRQASAYCVNLAASLPIFAEVAPTAFQGLIALVSGAKSIKKKDEAANVAMDNAVAAIFRLLLHQKQQCPDLPK